MDDIRYPHVAPPRSIQPPRLPHHFFREPAGGRSPWTNLDLKNKFVSCGTAAPPSPRPGFAVRRSPRRLQRRWTGAARGARRRRPSGGRSSSSSIHAERDSSCGARLRRSSPPHLKLCFSVLVHVIPEITACSACLVVESSRPPSQQVQ